MNNEMFLNVREEKMNTVMNQVSDDVRRPLMMLTQYYSKVLDRKLNLRQTLSLLNAQLAFFVTAFAGCSLMVRAFLFAWLVSALLKCKEVMK